MNDINHELENGQPEDVCNTESQVENQLEIVASSPRREIDESLLTGGSHAGGNGIRAPPPQYFGK